jgi:hypothetical protein
MAPVETLGSFPLNLKFLETDLEINYKRLK